MQAPPIFLILAGLLAVLTSGAALQEQIRQAWLREEALDFGRLAVPFAAISLGFCAMLAGGLLILSLPVGFTVVTTVLVVGGSAGLVWWRLTAELSGKGGGDFW